MVVKLDFFSPKTAGYNSTKKFDGSRNGSSNSLQKNYDPWVREKGANHGRPDAKYSGKIDRLV